MSSSPSPPTSSSVIELALRALEARLARAPRSPTLRRAVSALREALEVDVDLDDRLRNLEEAGRALSADAAAADDRAVASWLAAGRSAWLDELCRAPRDGGPVGGGVRPTEGAAPRLRRARRVASDERANLHEGHPEWLMAREAARHFMLEMATLGRLRRHADDFAWARSFDFELRLLANLDALVALQVTRRDEPAWDAIAGMRGFRAELPVEDPGRVFARAFLLACTDGKAAQSELIEVALGAAPREEDAVVDALALGSADHVEPTIFALLELDEFPRALRQGLGAAARRLIVPDEASLGMLEHPDAGVARAAAGLAARGTRDQVAASLRRALDRADEVVFAAADALIGVDPSTAREWVRGARSDATPESWTAQRLAILGDLRDVDDCIAMAESAPGAIAALGWLGHAAPTAWLMDAMTDGRDEIGALARVALTRIAGPSAAAPPQEVPTEATDRALVERAGALVRVDGRRVRRGAAWGFAPLLEDLSDPSSTQASRRLVELELRARFAQPIGFDLDGWFVAQRDGLRALATAREARH